MICASWYMRIMEFSSLPFYFLLNALKIIPHKSLYQPFIGRTNIYYSRYALSKIKWDWNVGKSRVLHKFHDNSWKLNTSITVVWIVAISWFESCTLYYPPISILLHKKYLNIVFSDMENWKISLITTLFGKTEWFVFWSSFLLFTYRHGFVLM